MRASSKLSWSLFLFLIIFCGIILSLKPLFNYMLYSNKPSASFFDEDGVAFGFKALGPKNQHPPELSSKPSLISPISCRDVSTNVITKGVFALHKTWLVYYGADITRLPKAAINLAHAKLKSLETPHMNNGGNGFLVTRNGTSIELTFSNTRDQDDWRFVLRKICVLSTFHEDYQGIKMIGRGAFARVYMIESKSTKTCYAAKAFAKDNIIHPERLRAKLALINEINLMRVIDHENIIKLHEVHETDKSVYLVIELVKGRTLESLIKHRTFIDDPSGSQTVRTLRSILEALQYLSAEGIMHRDLKPSNILVEEGGKVKIVDFGMATYFNNPSTKFIFNKCGTPGYIAPEVFKYDTNRDSTAYNDRCDVFSTGCILFYMLFGNPLIKGKKVSEIIELNKSPNFDSFTQVIKQELGSINCRFNREGLNLLLKLLEFDHKKRISAKEALKSSYFTPFINIKEGHSESFIGQNLDKLLQNPGNGADSPGILTSLRLNLGNSNNSIRSDDLSPSNIVFERCFQKESLFLDLGKSEMNGKTDTMSLGSGIHSVLKVPETPNTPSRKDSTFSPSSKNHILLQQKMKGQSKSFKVNSGTPKNNQTVYKAAIFRNMCSTTKNEDDEGKSDKGVVSFSQMIERRHSENQIPRTYDNDDSPSASFKDWKNLGNGDDNEEFDIGNEDSNISSDYEKFKESTPKKHTGEVLQKQSGFGNFTARKYN